MTAKKTTTPAKKTVAKKVAAPAKKAAAKKATAPKPKAATPYVLDTKRVRASKTAVSVLALTHSEAIIRQAKGDTLNKFAALCVDHSQMIAMRTRREAHQIGAKPQSWCEGCGAPKGTSVPVAPAKAKLAVKPGFGTKA